MRLAEFAILNPDTADSFSDTAGSTPPTPGRKELVFSPNYIKVEIQDHALPELAFIDLPEFTPNMKAREIQLLHDIMGSYATQTCFSIISSSAICTREHQALHHPDQCADLSCTGAVDPLPALCGLLARVVDDTLTNSQSTQSRRYEEDLAALSPMNVVISPTLSIFPLLTSLCDEFRGCVYGEIESSQLRQLIHTAYVVLKNVIQKTAPNLTPWLDKDDSKEDLKHLIRDLKPFSLYDVHRDMKRPSQRGPHPKASKSSLLVAAQSTWSSAVYNCFYMVRDSVLQAILECINQFFDSHEPIQTPLVSCAEDLVARNFETCSKFVETYLEIEQSCFTWTDYCLDEIPATSSTKHKDKRVDLGKHGADEEAQMEAIGEVLGCFQRSYERIIDNIPGMIELKFVKATQKALLPALLAIFLAGDSDD